MNTDYFDSHCHIQFDAYENDREELFTLMHKEKVGGLLVGVDLESSKRAVAQVQGKENFFASIGLHPNDTLKEEFDQGVYRELAKDSKVVAIGECGLDNFRPEDTVISKPVQRTVFLNHIQLAVETQKPLMIHARPSKGTQDAYHELIEILTSAKREFGELLSGNIHFFVGGIEEARALLALDFTLSYTAVLTFTHDYDEVVRFAPIRNLLSETDSPFIAPSPNRGKRNDPRAVMRVIEAMAEIRKEDVEYVRESVLTNSKRLFHI
jgi:TatD DNase family protein